jgi:hypothetical protein
MKSLSLIVLVPVLTACGDDAREPELVVVQIQGAEDETLRVAYNQTAGWHVYLAEGGIRHGSFAQYIGSAEGTQSIDEVFEAIDSGGGGSSFTGAAATATSFNGGSGASAGFAGGSGSASSFSAASPAATGFTSSGTTTASACNLAPLCDFVRSMCLLDGTNQECNPIANECRAQINSVQVPAQYAALLCDFIDFLVCIGNDFATATLAQLESCAQASGFTAELVGVEGP